MHKSRLGGLIIACETENLDSADKFRTRALGSQPIRSTAPDDTGYVPFKTTPGESHIELQQVTHPSRVHLDIETDDVDAEVARLEQIGAKKIEKVSSRWIMEAPTGHRFCVVGADSLDFDEKANRWD